jgi:hypothetical protein
MGMKQAIVEVNRRRQPRLRCALPVSFRNVGRSSDERAVTGNVSPGGMFVRSQVTPAVGSTLAIAVHLQNVTLRMWGVVVWTRLDEGFGLEITSSPEVWLDFILGAPGLECIREPE